MKKSAIAAAALALTLSGCTTDEPVTITKTATVTVEAAPPASNLPTLSDLFTSCKLDGLMNVNLSGDGSVLTLELPRNAIATLTVTGEEAACVAVGLEMPDAVISKIDATDDGDPLVSESWEDVTFTWKKSDTGTLTFIYEKSA